MLCPIASIEVRGLKDQFTQITHKKNGNSYLETDDFPLKCVETGHTEDVIPTAVHSVSTHLNYMQINPTNSIKYSK